MRMRAYLSGDSNIAATKIAEVEPVRCMVELDGNRQLMFTVSQDGAVGITWNPQLEPHDTVVWQIGQIGFLNDDMAQFLPTFEMFIPQRQ